MSNPIEELLNDEARRKQALTALGAAHQQFEGALEGYRDAWRQARNLGFAATDLTRAGLPNPDRFPRRRTKRNTTQAPANPVATTTE